MNLLVESQYAPNILYIKTLLNYETILIDNHENYVKSSYRNRCHILGANGLLRLTIPLESGKNQRKTMQDVKICNADNWQKIHWQSINSAYRRSAFFEFYEDKLVRFYEQKFNYLVDYNQQYLQTILAILKVNTNIQLTQKYYQNNSFEGNDLRSNFMPKDILLMPKYYQVFSDRFDFISNLSVLDLIFNLGNKSTDYINSIDVL